MIYEKIMSKNIYIFMLNMMKEIYINIKKECQTIIA